MNSIMFLGQASVLIIPVAFVIWIIVEINSLRTRVRQLEQTVHELAEGQPQPLSAPAVPSPPAAAAALPADAAALAPPPQASVTLPLPVPGTPPRYPLHASAPGAKPAHRQPARNVSTFSMPQGGTLFAIAGGLFVLIGALTFLGMAISRGWIGHGAQIGIGVAAGVVLMAVGVLVSRDRSGSGVRNAAGLITIGTGAGVITLSAIVGVYKYEVLSPTNGLLLVMAAAVASVIAALWFDSQLLAGFGVVTALASPVLTNAPADNFTLAAVGIALAATMVICVRRDWSWLALVAVAVTAPQLADWAGVFSEKPPAVMALTVAVVGWWLLLVASAFGFDLRRAAEKPRTSSASLIFLSSAIASGIVVLAETGHDERTAAWLGVFGITHLVIAIGALMVGVKRPAARYVALLLVSVGAAVLAWSIGIALDGPGRVAFWSVEAVVLVGVHRRSGDGRALVAAALAAALALGDAIFHQVGLPQLFNSTGAPTTVTTLIALGTPLAGAICVRFLSLGELKRNPMPASQPAAGGASAPAPTWDSPRNVMVAADVITFVTGTLLVATLAHDAFGDVGRTLSLIAGAVASAIVTTRWPNVARAIAARAIMGVAIADTLANGARPDGLDFGLADPFLACADIAVLVAGAALALRVAPANQIGAAARRVVISSIAFATFYLASLLVVTAFVTHPGDAANVGSTERAQLALSTFWAIAALLAIIIGLSRRIEVVHKVGAGLLAVAALKVLVIDTQHFGDSQRVAAFVGVGLIMLIGGFVYLRASAASAEDADGRRPDDS